LNYEARFYKSGCKNKPKSAKASNRRQKIEIDWQGSNFTEGLKAKQPAKQMLSRL